MSEPTRDKIIVSIVADTGPLREALRRAAEAEQRSRLMAPRTSLWQRIKRWLHPMRYGHRFCPDRLTGVVECARCWNLLDQ